MTNPSPNSDKADRSVLKSLGGEAGCKRLAKEFYARVAFNNELKPLFPGKSLRCATEEFSAFLVQLLEGDPGQTQHRWWLSLRESHARFRISDRQRTTWLALMHETIESLDLDSETRSAFGQFFESTSTYVVGQGEPEIDHSELKHLWGQQRALDRLVDALTNGHDENAMDLAKQFASQPSVLVGILARMMKTGRDPLIAFVLDGVQTVDGLRESRFNGRTLLHFAAGSSCVLVVRRLLSLGVDPNALDGGGHTALYRAASPFNSEHGADIVSALVQAGAAVDHSGGVNRSTALHEAARHGNLPVAEALLRSGASPWVRDKKGFTPYDRAINCRRHAVAALLAAHDRSGRLTKS